MVSRTALDRQLHVKERKMHKHIASSWPIFNIRDYFANKKKCQNNHTHKVHINTDLLPNSTFPVCFVCLFFKPYLIFFGGWGGGGGCCLFSICVEAVKRNEPHSSKLRPDKLGIVNIAVNCIKIAAVDLTMFSMMLFHQLNQHGPF